MRPSLVAGLCGLAAVAGAGGVLFAAKTGGWFDGERTVVQSGMIRQPLARTSLPSTIVVSKPVLSHGFAPQRIFSERANGVVTVFSYFGAKPRSATYEEGSGFVVSKSGIVLTAAHVIVSTSDSSALPTPAHQVYVQFSDGDKVLAQVVGWDPYDDVGVLRVPPKAHVLDPVPLGTSGTVAVGQPVAAIGSPFGAETSMSVGVVSGTDRTIPSLTTAYDLFDAIQTDAPVNQGNSGGPLLDAHGEVIGINAQIRSSLESGFDGVAFAVPIDSAKRSMAQLLASGTVAYAYLGLQSEDLTPSIANAFHLPAKHGAIVGSVDTPGPAATAGLRPGTHTLVFQSEKLTLGGDIIVAIDGTPVANSDDVARLIAERMVPGEAAWFTIWRDGKNLIIPVTLGARP
ncbi:MAG TPA: trypsin-like peptidase domain-containing protein [Gaiellaceae bacterium]|nr:trypsin-like peptidase domain-containing protein [Gaiellaceae bacterium]